MDKYIDFKVHILNFVCKDIMLGRIVISKHASLADLGKFDILQKFIGFFWKKLKWLKIRK